MWLERQVTEQIGLRAGYVYKTEDNLFALYVPTRGPDVYAQYGVPFNFTDIGVDGVRGTADDRVLTYIGLPTAGGFSTKQIEMNTGQYSRYKTAEVSMNKRYGNKWSGSMGFGYTWMTDFPNGPRRNPNNPGVEDRTVWNFKASGSYDAPAGLRISPVLRHQSGANYARTLAITAPAALALTATSFRQAALSDGTLAFAEPMNSNREDNIWVFDVRAEKSITITDRIRVRAYIDAFNITNSHASETISRATGLGYQKPSAILAPFTTRVGFRFIF